MSLEKAAPCVQRKELWATVLTRCSLFEASLYHVPVALSRGPAVTAPCCAFRLTLPPDSHSQHPIARPDTRCTLLETIGGHSIARLHACRLPQAQLAFHHAHQSFHKQLVLRQRCGLFRRGVGAPFRGRGGCAPTALLDLVFRRSSKQQPGAGIEDRVLSSILSTGSVPYSSYIAEPRSFLHDTHALFKQAWLVVVLGVAARSRAVVQLGLCLLTAAATAASLPRRLWGPQLKRLGLLSLLLFVMTALGADGVPPVQQARTPPPALTGLPELSTTSSNYRFVIFHWGFLTITRRSLTLAASAASLTFLALQSASLALTTTPSEDIALALRSLLRPLAWVGVPVQHITLTVLLALRFLALVLEEGRNLALGLAMRGLDWRALGPGSGILVVLRLFGRLFDNLLRKSSDIAVAIHARGYVSADSHAIYTGTCRSSLPVNNVLCGAAILGLIAQAAILR